MKFTATRAIQLPAGTLVKFNEAQARRRAAQLQNIKGRQYECLVPVWVKAGEVIDLEDPAKHLLASLQPLGRSRADAPDSPEPAAPEQAAAPAPAAPAAE